jgi:hypothetical protein
MNLLHGMTASFAALIVIIATTSEAQAAPPASCSTGLAASSYKTGQRIGKNLVKSAWGNIDDCDRIDQFLEIVEENVSRLTLKENPSNSTVCRYTGTVDGVYEELDGLYGTCADQCFLDGTFAGQLSAEVYCELSIALGGLVEADDFLRGPVAICGLNFEIGCDSEFIAVSTVYENPDGECVTYTEGEFEEVWEQSRYNQCAYVIEDPTPLVSEGGTAW